MVKFKWNINDQIFFINYKYIIILIKQLMIRINPIARTAFRVLQTQITHNFGGPTPLLDPSKHITMGKYSHALFIDEYDIGQYP